MNEVSIIINGVRYDAVVNSSTLHPCDICECKEECCFILKCCPLESSYFFKKSDKKFEK